MAQGAAAGRYSVKSCGMAHAWCRVCRPQQVELLRKPKPPRAAYDRPCRNCGMCDACLGLTAPDGMKVCRKCHEAKTLDQFQSRGPHRGPRNSCKSCENKKYESLECSNCSRRFWRHINSTEVNCHDCRPLVGRQCKWCGSSFVGSLFRKEYCSDPCRDAATEEARRTARQKVREEALRAYGGATPYCACCGESGHFFLALDHINGGGHKQRKETGGGGFYSWLRKNNYPSGFRVLCHNCNYARHLNGGECPHKTM
jgi:hypothetical protein